MKYEQFCFAELASLETFTQVEGDTTTDIPETKHIFNDNCFKGCPKLRTVNLPSNIGSLGLYCFTDCKMLTGFVFPPELTKCQCHSFERCTSITEMDLSNVKWLGNHVFDGCTNLVKIIFSDKLRDVMGNTFNGCTKLPELTGLETNEHFTFKRRFLYGCSSLTHFKIPRMMTMIPFEALRNCRSLSRLTIHDGITFIEYDAFSFTGITEITMPSELSTLEKNVLRKCLNLRKVDFSYCYNLISLPNDLFAGDVSLSEIVLPPKLESIPNYAFSGTSLESIIFPETFRQFGNSVFMDCKQLKSVYIFGKSLFLSSQMFSGCSSLTKIYINPEISMVERNTFDGITQNVEIVYCSNRIFTDTSVNSNQYLTVKVPSGYEKETFLGLPINKVDN